MVDDEMKETKMKVAFLLFLLLSACGFSAKDNELIGQAKKIVHNTPVFCSDYDSADVSLGVMRNGIGSLSKEDVEFYIVRARDARLFALAAEKGLLVKVTYSIKRVNWCAPDHWATKVEVVSDPPTGEAAKP